MTNIKIISQEEAENEENGVLICNRKDQPSPFDDNEYGNCVGCGTPIYWRSHAPKNLQRMCAPCGFGMALAESADGEEIDVAVTELSKEEADIYFGRKPK